jgi:hypothetical protein
MAAMRLTCADAASAIADETLAAAALGPDVAHASSSASSSP